jgi:phage protein D
MPDVLKPDYQIYDDGAKVQDDVKSAVISIVVDERLDQAAVCTIELSDKDGRLSDGKHFKLCADLKVELGYVGTGTKTVFEGEVTGWKGAFPRRGPGTLTVIAMDRFHRFRRERKQRTFKHMKDSEIASEVASDYGCSADAMTTQVKHDYIVQFNQSDADFLLERASVNGHELFVDGKKLVFRQPKLDQGPAAKLKWHETLKRFAPTLSLVQAHPSVKTTSWDMLQKKMILSHAKKGDEVSLMGATRTGSDLGSKGEFHGHRPLLAPEEMDVLAKAELNRGAMSLIKGEGDAKGTNTIRRGSIIEVDGIGEFLSGSYYVVTAVHSLIPGSAYSTTFRVRRTAVQKPPTPPPATAPAQPSKAAPPDPTPEKVEFVVKNQFGEPLEGLEYVLTCPDGEKKTGTVPASGVVSETKAKPGTYTLAIKGIDQPTLKVES